MNNLPDRLVRIQEPIARNLLVGAPISRFGDYGRAEPVDKRSWAGGRIQEPIIPEREGPQAKYLITAPIDERGQQSEEELVRELRGQVVEQPLKGIQGGWICPVAPGMYRVGVAGHRYAATAGMPSFSATCQPAIDNPEFTISSASRAAWKVASKTLPRTGANLCSIHWLTRIGLFPS